MKFHPSKIAKTLSFFDGFKLAYRLLFNRDRDDEISEFAIDLLLALKDYYSEEWSKNWKYDAFIGNACVFLSRRYDLRYESYRNAVQKSDNPPADLLTQLAFCYISPGHPPVTLQEAERLALEI